MTEGSNKNSLVPDVNQEGKEPLNEKKAKRGKKSEPVHEVEQLVPELQAKVRKLLVDGATFEDTIAFLEESAHVKLTIRAVENHFRAQVDIQEERILRQVETAENLKKALKDPKSAHAQLAEAVLFTGLMRLSNKTAATDIQNAIKVKSQAESNRLKEDTLKLRVRKLQSDNRMMKVRLEHELEKIADLRQKVEKVRNEFDRAGKSQRVGPETMKRIQEIYGLLSEPTTEGEKNGQTAEA